LIVGLYFAMFNLTLVVMLLIFLLLKAVGPNTGPVSVRCEMAQSVGAATAVYRDCR
jgi:hypothetical protein